MSRLWWLAALAFAIVSAVDAQNSTAGGGIITVQNAKFVTNTCREFQFAGGNVYVIYGLLRCNQLPCVPAGHRLT